MRTSLNDIKTIEAYLQGTQSNADRLLFEARLLVSKTLRKNLALQRGVYKIVQHHYRDSVREEFQRTHRQLFSDKSNADLKKTILSIFNP